MNVYTYEYGLNHDSKVMSNGLPTICNLQLTFIIFILALNKIEKEKFLNSSIGSS